MARRKKGRPLDGILLLDKPTGGSSNAVLQQVRRMYNAQKAGHTGSLDPLASGMLPICFGEATKFSHYLLNSDKAYKVTAKLGVTTTTADAEGEVREVRDVSVTESELLKVVQSFAGESMQIPSMFSALKQEPDSEITKIAHRIDDEYARVITLKWHAEDGTFFVPGFAGF